VADMLKRGSEWLEQMRTAHMTSPVEYQRATDPPQALTVNATFGRTRYEVADESGLTVGSHVWDFLILADDLGFEPAPADVIVANGRRYEVMNLGPDRAWRWSDAFRQTYRIHTKDIGADP